MRFKTFLLLDLSPLPSLSKSPDHNNHIASALGTHRRCPCNPGGRRRKLGSGSSWRLLLCGTLAWCSFELQMASRAGIHTNVCSTAWHGRQCFMKMSQLVIWHWPVAQRTFGEILKAIVMISHRSALNLPRPYYCKKPQEIKNPEAFTTQFPAQQT